MSAELPADPEPRASILIAAFNPPTFGRCVRSLARHLPGDAACEVIATLNGPSDALLESARGVEGLRTIDTPVNLGLAAGANLARDAARGELLVLVQDDAEIEAGWLEALVVRADEHRDAGAVGGLVCWPDGDRVQTAGLVLWDDCSHSEVGADTRPADWDEREPFAVDYASSSSLLVRAETWDEIGGLDDSFFPAGHVDADLAMRIRRSGRPVLVQPRARSRHRRGASSTQRFKRFIAVRNALMFRERGARSSQAPRSRGAPTAPMRSSERWPGRPSAARRSPQRAGRAAALRRRGRPAGPAPGGPIRSRSRFATSSSIESTRRTSSPPSIASRPRSRSCGNG